MKARRVYMDGVCLRCGGPCARRRTYCDSCWPLVRDKIQAQKLGLDPLALDMSAPMRRQKRLPARPYDELP